LTVGESLRKNARFLISGLLSAVVILFVWRAVDGAPLFQPQSDLGIVLGAILVAGFVVFQDMRDSQEKPKSEKPQP
jgi:predicted negative regulator of RcsB-dependent stress response